MEHSTTIKFHTNTVVGRQQSRLLTDVCGEIKLSGAPLYGLVLVTESDVIPLVPVDSARHLVHWISCEGHQVVIKKLLAVCEEFQVLKKNPVKHQNYLVKWDDVRILEVNGIKSRSEKIQIREKSLETKRNIKFLKKAETESIMESDRTCRILVHHVSKPFHVTEDTSVACMVFISYSNCNNIESKLWLVLQAEQVAWHEFLVPNREYLLHFPSKTDRFSFDKSQKPLDTIMKINIRELRVIFHHKNLFSKYGILNGSVVPSGTKIYLSPNSSFSEYVYRFTSDSLWFTSWFSMCEADHASVPLVTLYGKITSVMYLEEEVYKSCYLCIRKKPKEPEISSPKSSGAQVWMDPLKNGLVLDENVLLELPNVTNESDLRMNTGVPGGLVQVIKLEDVLTGEERSVYIKHSYVNSCRQMPRLAVGVCVCISHLNRRCSSAGNRYYITTMLSCCRVLDYRDGDTQSPAIAWMNVNHDNKTITMEKVLIKDDLVRKWLCIPEKMWLVLQEMAAEQEIVAFKDQALNDTSALTPLRRCFQLYCSVKSREKFYISVKKLSPQDGEDLYYCINLEPINRARLDVVARLAVLART